MLNVLVMVEKFSSQLFELYYMKFIIPVSVAQCNVGAMRVGATMQVLFAETITLELFQLVLHWMRFVANLSYLLFTHRQEGIFKFYKM